MSIEFFSRDYDAPERDLCGSLTCAVLKVNSILIPLCEDCVKELTEEVNKFKSTIFCYKCKHFAPDKYGLEYGGICKKVQEPNQRKKRDFMETCKEAEDKHD